MSSSLYHDWGVTNILPTIQERSQEGQKDLENANAYVQHRINGTAQKIHPRCSIILSAIHGDFCHFVSEARLKGIQVSTHIA